MKQYYLSIGCILIAISLILWVFIVTVEAQTTTEETIKKATTTEETTLNAENLGVEMLIEESPKIKEEPIYEMMSLPTELEDIMTDIVSYWKLDESSGTAYDILESYNLTNNGTATYGTGIINNGINITSSGPKYLSNATNLGLNGTTSISFSFWGKISTQPSAETSKYFFIWTSTGGTDSYNGLVYADDSDSLEGKKGIGWANNAHIVAPYETTLENDTWHHFVLTVTEGLYGKIYLDGELVSNAYGTAYSLSDNYFNIGFGANSLIGSVDEFGVWNRVLTGDEVLALYNEGDGCQYPFECEEEATSTATSTTSTTTNALLGNLIFGQAIQLTLLFLFFISWIFGNLFNHKKQWDNF